MLYSHPNIELQEHLLKTKSLISDFCKEINIPDNLVRVAELIGLTHDLGKSTLFFQNHLFGKSVNPTLSSHSLLSAIIALSLLETDLQDELKLPFYLAIRSHHSNLKSIPDMLPGTTKEIKGNDLEILQKQLKAIDRKEFSELLKKLGLSGELEIVNDIQKIRRLIFKLRRLRRKQSLKTYLTTNLFLGMLNDADIRAVIDMPANSERVEIPENIVDNFLLTLPKSEISPLRKEFYNTVIDNINNEGIIEKNIFSITAPTGIGKTLAGLSFALKLRDKIMKKENRLPRIIYVLPFTSIIDQTFDILFNFLKLHFQKDEINEILLRHHFKSDSASNLIPDKLNEINLLKSKNEEIVKLYEQAFNRVETWDGEIIVTTFWRYFETLFTNKRAEMRRLHRLLGSIVIMDEIQNVPPRHWNILEEFMNIFSFFGAKFILMTATKPELFSNPFELTQEKTKKFFFSLSRTKLHINLNETEYTELQSWLLPIFKKHHDKNSFLIVLNTIRSAQDVFRELSEMRKQGTKELENFKLFFLSASLIPLEREKRIDDIKRLLKLKQKIILVSTQVIEAGVDLDFDIVLRDLAPLDSLIQVAGRCQRNVIRSNEGNVFVFNLTDKNRHLASYIYDPILRDSTRKILSTINSIEESRYYDIIAKYFHEINSRISPMLDEDFKLLNYDKISKFSLIRNNGKAEDIYTVPVFIETKESNESSLLIDKLKELEKCQNRYLRKIYFKQISSKIWIHVVNVKENVARKLGLPILPFLSSFLYLPKDHPGFEDIYKKETGFISSLEEIENVF